MIVICLIFLKKVTILLFQRDASIFFLASLETAGHRFTAVISSDSSRGRPSQAEGQGEAETLRLSPRFQAELIVLYILGRAEGRVPRAEGRGSRAERSQLSSNF